MAFFSNQGTTIHSAAAGGRLMAFQDGSLGRRRRRRIVRRRRRRPIRSLYSIYSQRAAIRGLGEYFTGVAGGPLMAFQDGSLGKADFGPLRAYEDGSLGASSGKLMAFHDGSLGMPLFLESGGELRHLDEPVTIHHGSMGEYFSGTAGCSGCGLGQAAATETAVFDLSDPASLQEFKMAVGYAPWVLPNIETGGEEIEADIANPRWTEFTTRLVDAWMSGYVQFLDGLAAGGSAPKKADGSPLSSTEVAAQLDAAFPLPNRYPTPEGLFFVFLGASIMMQPPAGGGDPLLPPGSLPIMQSTLASYPNVEVLPPVQGGVSQANLMAIGVGVAAVALVGALAFGSKKKRRR